MILHPKPLARPIVLKEAIKNIPSDKISDKFLTLHGKTSDLIKRAKQGECLADVYFRDTGKNSFFNFYRLDMNKVSRIICKSSAGLIHPIKNRTLSIGEYKRVASFPDSYRFDCAFNKALHRMGNSVPPLFMRAIAANVHNILFNGEVPMKFHKNLKYPEILDLAWNEHIAPRKENAPTVISTFAGGGGSSLGYSMAGYRELLAVEWDDNAVETFKLNFPDIPVYHGDIAKLSVKQCMKLAGLKNEGELDIFDGSPPCQGFSIAGKRDFSDNRNQLFKEYVRLLRGLKPKVFVMENVSGMVKGKMKLIFADVMRELKASGYQVKCQLMNAKYFYVPQSRERLIFIGVRNDIAKNPSHPKPLARPFTVNEAISDVKTRNELTDVQKYWWGKIKPGQVASKVHPKGHWFSFQKLKKDQVCPTVIKAAGGSKFCYWDKPYGLSIDSYKRIGSFPDLFKFIGGYKHAKNRIGNSVPPLLVRAIAYHINMSILQS
jgi:DNA (cytosine-5)-methyltransferase 1